MRIDAYDQLEGLLKTPSLFLDKCPFFELFDTPILNSRTLKDLISELEVPQRLVFGRRMEYLFSEWLKSSDRYKLIQEKVQIFDGKVTLGELDFLIFDRKEKQQIHLELVCKFYLYEASSKKDEFDPWIGVNKKDRLTNKLNKIIGQQLPIFHHEKCQAQLEKVNWGLEETVQKVCFKALLFTPFNQELKPNTIHSKAVVGYWMRMEDFQGSNFENERYYLPEKQNWMVDPKTIDLKSSFDENGWMTYNETLKRIDLKLAIERSPLCWMKRNNGNYERFFVVWW